MGIKDFLWYFLDSINETLLMSKIIWSKKVELKRLEKEVLAADIRMAAHILDKDVQLFSKPTWIFWKRKLSRAIDTWNKRFSTEDENFLWAKDILNRYETRNIRAEPSYNVQDADELLNLIRTRRSVRRFKREDINDCIITKIIEAASWAPSSCNRQPCRFIIIKDRNLKKKIGSSLVGAVGFASNATIIIVVLVDLRVYSFPNERHAPYLDGAVAAMNILLAVHAFGLGGCFMIWNLKKDEKKLLNLLGVENYMLPICAIAVGRPALIPPPPPRTPFKNITKIV